MDAAPINHIEIVDGRAMIRGKNIKAKLVASLIVKAGATVEEAVEQYQLTPAEVHAALAYYYDHRETIEQSFDEAEAYVKEVGISSDALKAKLREKSS
jgi:uncharacterized protein (DUF433 family)